MKTADKSRDPVLEEFFAAYRRQDRHLSIPVFPKSPKNIRKRTLAVLGIAASISIALFYFPKAEEDISLDRNLLIISLEKNEEQDPTIVVTTTTSMDIWESPTESLLTEF
ncbi:hypothetical protein SAMN04488057_10217 [Cyclobacterium lianum]|uniref:Uncharacterized protein n=1 Tax=Cyclobacterium lianum TaxID=388280 RepID=A0A1M7JHL2_9BACT|nr:hypothetical protein [Cyclobacterium lianum]SHM52455.1 hypothetical protein SAMN04488057_10217 [Cyclobacterium lianum]